MTKRIVLFVPSFEKGGVERNAVFFANSMVERGFDLTLLYCRKQDGWFDRLDAKVETLKVGASLRVPIIHERIMDAANMLVFGLSALFKMKTQDQLVIVSFQSNVIAIILAKLLALPVAVRLSNHFSSVDNERSLLRRVSELGKKLFYGQADVVVANSSELARDYAAVFRREVITIHNPIDFELIERLRNEEVEEEIFTKKNRPIIISAGRLARQKNYELLILAISKVVQKVPCDLVIIGEGAERQALEALVRKLGLSDYVHLIGHRKNPYKYYCCSALFVLSSNYEGMPNVLIEAIACGLPVVSTRCKSGPNEILDYGAGGLLCDCNDADGMAGNILLTLEDSAAMQNLRHYARDYVNKYEISKISMKYQVLVNSLFERASHNKIDAHLS